MNYRGTINYQFGAKASHNSVRNLLRSIFKLKILKDEISFNFVGSEFQNWALIGNGEFC